jgi:predicted metal-dependent peptidase
LDLLVEKCIKILFDAPGGERLRFKIVILASTADIEKSYSEIYGKGTDFIAFYSPKIDTVFISVDELKQGILAHEIAHVIIQHYFYNAPSRMIHEAIAQLVETQIEK